MSDPDHTVTALPLPAASSAAQSDLGHSDIFDRLSASNDGDLIGLMAYRLYQRRKRAWMEDFRATEGRYPNTKEKQAYAFSYRADALEALRRDAEAIMAAFADQAIDQRIHEMRTDALAAETHQVITQIHRRLGEIGGYWHHIVGHLVGFCVLAGAVAVFAVVVRYEPSLDKIQEGGQTGFELLGLLVGAMALVWASGKLYTKIRPRLPWSGAEHKNR